MFSFLKKKKLQAIQEGKAPFYSFPDKHKQSLVDSLASVLPIIFSSNRACEIHFERAANSRSNVVVLLLSSTKLRVLNPECLGELDLSLLSLTLIENTNEFTVVSNKNREIAEDIYRIVVALLMVEDSHSFKCFWSRHEQITRNQNRAVSEDLLDEVDIIEIERRYRLALPASYREMLKNTSRAHPQGNQAVQVAYLTKDEFIAENDRVRQTSPYSDLWNDSWFIIGTDGSGNDYFIATRESSDKVFEIDHEQVMDAGYDPLASPRYDSIESFFSHLEK